jgi:hypothetical protein
MAYAGGVREVSSDGTIRISGSPRASGALAVGFYFALMVVMPVLAITRGDPGIGLVLLLMLLTFSLPLLPMLFSSRTVVFDAARRELRVLDQGFKRAKLLVPFNEITDIRFIQREPRTVANEPPTLVVNGRDLLTIKDAYANRGLELELKTLVGLPPVESPRDTRGWSGA